jgi:hypothetical protein
MGELTPACSATFSVEEDLGISGKQGKFLQADSRGSWRLVYFIRAFCVRMNLAKGHLIIKD